MGKISVNDVVPRLRVTGKGDLLVELVQLAKRGRKINFKNACHRRIRFLRPHSTRNNLQHRPSTVLHSEYRVFLCFCVCVFCFVLLLLLLCVFSGIFPHTLPRYFTPPKTHSLAPRSCTPTLSRFKHGFGFYLCWSKQRGRL